MVKNKLPKFVTVARESDWLYIYIDIVQEFAIYAPDVHVDDNPLLGELASLAHYRKSFLIHPMVGLEFLHRVRELMDNGDRPLFMGAGGDLSSHPKPGCVAVVVKRQGKLAEDEVSLAIEQLEQFFALVNGDISAYDFTKYECKSCPEWPVPVDDEYVKEHWWTLNDFYEEVDAVSSIGEEPPEELHEPGTPLIYMS